MLDKRVVLKKKLYPSVLIKTKGGVSAPVGHGHRHNTDNGGSKHSYIVGK